MMPTRPTVPVERGTFAVVTSGFADGPAQPLRDHLLQRGAREVVMVSHPLVAEHPEPHTIVRYRGGEEIERTTVSLPNHPPYTYAFDPFVPLSLPRVDGWFGFNCLATGVGIARRAAGRVGRVVHWSVDFVPDRFGPGVLTRLYERTDEWCCRRADGRVDLSEAALDGRNRAYGLEAWSSAPAVVVPMGAWVGATPKATRASLDARRVVFMGHLVPRMGVDTLLDALELLVAGGVVVAADVIGGGPLEREVRDRVARSSLRDHVVVHGFVEDHRDVARLLAAAAIAVAPYDEASDSFSRFADPGKLKAYLGAGLPILLTDVPPNAKEVATEGGAELLAGRADAFARAIARLLDDPDEWARRHGAATGFALRYDWSRLFDAALPRLGITGA
jgi:glycosyltransferase involved in cell wall biosynthesis